MTDSSQYVTLPIVRELLETQERSFKTMVQMFFESVKSEVRDIRKEVIDLKESLTFSQKDIEEAKVIIKNIKSKVTKETSTKPTRILKIYTIVMNTLKIIAGEATSKFSGFQKRQRLKAQNSGKSVKML